MGFYKLKKKKINIVRKVAKKQLDEVTLIVKKEGSRGFYLVVYVVIVCVLYEFAYSLFEKTTFVATEFASMT